MRSLPLAFAVAAVLVSHTRLLVVVQGWEGLWLQ